MVTTGIFGKWTLKFTSDTDATLIAPDGSSTNVVVPAHNVGHFAEQATPGFRIYLGMQANNANAQNQAVVYANFEVAGTPSPFSENFLTDEKSKSFFSSEIYQNRERLTEDEKPKIFMKTDAIKPKKKDDAGPAFHEKSAKNSKVNFIVRHKDRMMKKYGKPIRRGPKK